MIRVVLRLLVTLAVLTSPVMASSMAAPAMAEASQGLLLLVDDGSAAGCLRPPPACWFCQACLAVPDDPGAGLDVLGRDPRPPASADVLVGLLGNTEPIPP